MYERMAQTIRANQRFLLTGHVRADGDCLGAECALFHLLTILGKQVSIVNPDPLSQRYKFLAAHTPFQHWDPSKSDGGVEPFDVAVLLDCAVLDRAGPVGARIRSLSAVTCVVDHHQPGGGAPFHVEFVDPAAPASGVLVYRLAKYMNVQLPIAALEAVFVSLATDTGWFKYSNTDREAFHAAGDLVAAGVSIASVYGKLYQTYPPDYPIGMGITLRSLRYEAGGRLAVVTVRSSELRAAGAELAETEDVLDILRSVAQVDVVLLFREPQNGRVKCSARSKGEVDVHALMSQFGGGGHKKAAGADLGGPFDECVGRVVAAAIALIVATPARMIPA